MNRLRFLSKLVIGCLILFTEVNFQIRQKAQGAEAYAYSNFELRDFEIIGLSENLDFLTITSSGVGFGELSCFNVDFINGDAENCFIADAVDPIPDENFFGVWGDPTLLPNPPFDGTKIPKFSRGDVVISGDPRLGTFNGENVAEAYVAGKEAQATAEGEWEWGSDFFRPTVPGKIELQGDYNYLLGVEITGFDPGDNKISQAEFIFEVQLNGFKTDGTRSLINQYRLTESIELLNQNGSIIRNIGGLFSADLEFDQDDLDEFDRFSVVASAIEEVSVKVVQVPEPQTTFGILVLGGLGFKLTKKRIIK